MNTDLRTLVRAPLDDLLINYVDYLSDAALIAADHPTAAGFMRAEAEKIATEIRRRTAHREPVKPTVCACPDMILLPVGALATIELDGSHHGPETCEPCGVVAS